MLTSNQTRYSLTLPLTYSTVGIGVPKPHGISRKLAVFLCAKSQFFIMSSWVEQLKDWLGRVSSTPILLSFGTMIGVMLPGFKILTHGGHYA